MSHVSRVTDSTLELGDMCVNNLTTIDMDKPAN
jgi:hypothetical protein